MTYDDFLSLWAAEISTGYFAHNHHNVAFFMVCLACEMLYGNHESVLRECVFFERSVKK